MYTLLQRTIIDAGPQGDDVLYVDPTGAWLLLSMQESIDQYPAVFRFDLATGARTKVVKPHVFVGYQGEGHGLEDPQHTIDWLDRRESFLQTHNPAQ